MKPLLAWRGVHYVARTFGWQTLQHAAMDAKYRCGDWGREKEPSALVRVVEAFANKGRLLMLGCGTNNIARQLRDDAYADVTGVDFSKAAIDIAKSYAKQGHYYHTSNMETFCLGRFYSVILFNESLYYVTLSKLPIFLEKCGNALSSDGVMIATFDNEKKHYRMVGYILRKCCVVDMFRVGQRLILIFKQ